MTIEGMHSFDALGRLVLPRRERMLAGLEKQDAVEIFTEGDCIIIQKYRPSCVFCSGTSDVIELQGRNVCRSCLKELCSLPLED